MQQYRLMGILMLIGLLIGCSTGSATPSPTHAQRPAEVAAPTQTAIVPEPTGIAPATQRQAQPVATRSASLVAAPTISTESKFRSEPSTAADA
ncbi:MAG: hypothetical protein NZQ09_13595 [Chloroflexus sp.]|nr:hypothetical protein [Chloroflexus sp.]